MLLPALRPSAVRPADALSEHRAEVRIRELRLSDGVIRYGVPLLINGEEVVAGLDTGAVGLRLRPDAPGRDKAKVSTKSEDYTFGSGAHLDGVAGTVHVQLGSLSGKVPAHLVQKIGCIARSPNCPGRLGLGYGFLGDGLPGEGFRVLLGGNMGAASIGNPLMALGVRRWIVELPRPGEGGDGRLILNPTDEEVKAFTMVRLVGGFREQDGGMHDAVWACLQNDATRARACGPALLDTGAFLLRINNAGLTEPWARDAPMTLGLMNDGATTTAAVRMTIGHQAQAVAFGAVPFGGVVLQPGVAAYYAYSVLYDPAGRRLGFKPRPPLPGLPTPRPSVP